MTLELVTDKRGLELDWAGVVVVAGSERSETGGDGGVGVSEVVEEADLVGGVARVGDEAVVEGECTDIEDCGRETLTPRGVGFLKCDRSVKASTFLNLSCLISASTLRSDNSSRSL